MRCSTFKSYVSGFGIGKIEGFEENVKILGEADCNSNGLALERIMATKST